MPLNERKTLKKHLYCLYFHNTKKFGENIFNKNHERDLISL